MNIKYAFTAKKISTADLVSDYMLSVDLPSEVKTAVNAGKVVWYSAEAYVSNTTGRENANKKVRIAVKQGFPVFASGDNTISQIISIENILGSGSTSLSGSPSVFGMKLVRNAVDPVIFAFRRLEELDYDPEIDITANVSFFIPE